MTEKETSSKSKPTIFSMVAIGLTIAFFGIPVLIFIAFIPIFILLIPIYVLCYLCGAFLLQKATKLVAKFDLSYKQSSRIVAISATFGIPLILIMSPLLNYMHSYIFSIFLLFTSFVFQVIIYTKLIKNPETGFINNTTASKIAAIVFLVSGLVFFIIGLTLRYWLTGMLHH